MLIIPIIIVRFGIYQNKCIYYLKRNNKMMIVNRDHKEAWSTRKEEWYADHTTMDQGYHLPRVLGSCLFGRWWRVKEREMEVSYPSHYRYTWEPFRYFPSMWAWPPRTSRVYGWRYVLLYKFINKNYSRTRRRGLQIKQIKYGGLVLDWWHMFSYQILKGDNVI